LPSHSLPEQPEEQAVSQPPAAAAPEALVLDLVEWLARSERTYEQTMDAWRTSCPRLPVWEDANDRGLVATELSGGQLMVRVTTAGRALLERSLLERSGRQYL
jgi:hypothetical protein